MRNVLIIGAGMMGTQIALQCAMNKYNVTVYDVKEESLQYSKKTLQYYLAGFESKGIIDSELFKAISDNIRFSTNAEEAGKNADIVSESVPEDPKLKGAIFKQFNEICPPSSIFTTNTSTLIPSMFSEETGRPDKFLALHFHPNVWENRIVDIMPHTATSKETVEAVKEFSRSIDQIPIMLEKEHHSYVFNNMLSALLTSAVSLAANNVASIQDVDRSWMGIMHTNIGPFGIIDMVGMETVYSITKYWADATGSPERIANAAFLEKYVKDGLLGIKTQKGFYTYPDPEYARKDFIE